MDNEELTQEGIFQETETPQDSSPETTEAEVSESSTEDSKQDEGKLPFNEDPKIQEYINRQVEKRMEKDLGEFRSFKEQAEPIFSRFKPQEEIEIPSWFGGGSQDESNVKAYREYEAGQRKLVEEAEERAIKRIKSEQEESEKRIKSANDWFEENVKSFEAKGDKVDRNKLLKTVQDYELVDTEGRWNYKAGFEILKREKALKEATKAEELEVKKETASLTVSESKAENSGVQYKIPRFLQRKR